MERKLLKRKLIATLIPATVIASPVVAEDSPNAAIEAETARLTAESARINAEAALVAAKVARDKAQIDNLGLPKFDNKTTLEEGGGAIETSLLSTRAVQAAAKVISMKIAAKIPTTKNNSCPKQVVVLAGNASLNLNSAATIESYIGYLDDALKEELSRSIGGGRGPASIGVATVTAAISALSGLVGNEVSVKGVTLDEINDQMLANAVAGSIGNCVYLPSAGKPVVDIEASALAEALAELQTNRRDAAVWIARLRKKPTPKQSEKATKLKLLGTEFDEFYKKLSALDGNGNSMFINALLVEKLAKDQPYILRVVVNKAGGTITNSKNLGTFFGVDPVRVSGGLVASWAMVDSKTGFVKSSGIIACQTARVRLKHVQSGKWRTFKTVKRGNRLVLEKQSPQSAYCG